MPTPLPTLLDVLDGADEAQQQRLLTQTVLALDTGHTEEDVEAGVKAHLAKGLHGSMKGTDPGTVAATPMTDTDFGWRRPTSEEERQQRLAHRLHLTRRPFENLISWVSIKAVGLTFLIGSGLGTMAFLHKHPGDDVGQVLTLLLLTILMISGIVGRLVEDLVVGPVVADHWRCTPQILSDSIWEDIQQDPSCQTYLQAIARSWVPRILGGDKQRLWKLIGPYYKQKEAERKRRQAEQAVDLEKEQAVEQQREEARQQQRLMTFKGDNTPE